VRGERPRQDVAKVLGIVGVAKAVERRRIADEARNSSQRLEVISAGLLRCEKKEQQVNRLAVVAFEWNRALQAREQAGNGFDVGQLDVRNGNSPPEACRAQPFTLQ